MTDYHRDPGYLKLAKGVVRVENRYSLNIHQRDDHYNEMDKDNDISQRIHHAPQGYVPPPTYTYSKARNESS